MRLEGILKNATDSFGRRDYSGAIGYYQQAINMGASLSNNQITNLSTAFYERGKQNRDSGNLRQAVSDFNESMRHQYMMSRQKYADWKDLLDIYQQAHNEPAPHGGYAKLIFPANDNLTILYERPANGQTNPNETVGNGWNINLLAGNRIFHLTYDEPNFNRGNLRSDSVRVSMNAEAGRIYQAQAIVSGSHVTITVTDVTDFELRGLHGMDERPLFSRTIELRTVTQRQQTVSINIRNSTGYTITGASMVPSGLSNVRESDVILLNLGGNLRTNNTRRVTLPALDLTRRYDFMLMDTDGDFYYRRAVTVTPDMTVTFTFSDFIPGSSFD
jgi:hypothetical protein